MVGASEALRIGLVAEVVAAEGLAARAGELAGELAAGAPLAQQFIKTGLDRSFEMSFDEALGFEEKAQAICMTSEDVVEGVSAFLQKRDPDFKGR
jgi:enoyl-CoA hydratase